MYDVVFTAGHGGRNKFDPGAVGYIREHDEAVRLMNEVVSILNTNGLRAIGLVDNTSTTVNDNLYELVRLSNSKPAKKAIQLHFNATGGDQPGGYGVEVYVNQQAHMGQAGRFSKVMADAMGLKNRGAKYGNWYFNRFTTNQAFLFEVCFVNSKFDTDQYKKRFKELAVAIAEEVGQQVGKPFKVKSAPPKQEKKDDNFMKLNDNQKQELAKLFKDARLKGLFSSDKHEKDVLAGKMDRDRAIYLVALIAAGKRFQ